MSAMIPTSSRPASSRSASASASEVTNAVVSRCDGWIGSKPRATPASRATAAARVSPATTIARASAADRSPAGPLRTSTHSGSYAASRSIDAQIASSRSAGSAGPSMPGIPSWRNDGTVGTQFETPRPCSASSARFAASSAGSFISQRPIASKPAASVGLDLLGEARVHRRDRGEGELHERPGSFARRRRPSAGFVSSFATR